MIFCMAALLCQIDPGDVPGDQQLHRVHGPQLQIGPPDLDDELAAADVNLIAAVGQDAPVIFHAELPHSHT